METSHHNHEVSVVRAIDQNHVNHLQVQSTTPATPTTRDNGSVERWVKPGAAYPTSTSLPSAALEEHLDVRPTPVLLTPSALQSAARHASYQPSCLARLLQQPSQVAVTESSGKAGIA